MHRLSKRSLSRLKGVNPLLIAIFVDAIRNSPYDFGIPNDGGYRSTEQQKALYNKVPSVTNCDGVFNKSYHQTGNAIDIYAYINGGASWDKNIIKEIADHLIKVAKDRYNTELIWGGNFSSFYDGAHFQIS